MTFEEMQAVIAGMLQVQRNLQESQLRDREDIGSMSLFWDSLESQ